MYCHFIPRRKDSEIKMHRGEPESIGKYVRPLEIEDVKELLREGVRQIVEYNTMGFLVWIPPSECFEYWKWAQPSIVKNGDGIRLDDYPHHFALAPYEFVSHSGDRIILFANYH